MKTLIVALWAGLAVFASAHAAEDEFVFQVTAPNFKVTIPDLPALKMGPHPLQGTHPHLRFMGSEGPWAVSILTPAADRGMTALECASATLRTIRSRPNVPPDIYRARLNENTYVAIYGSNAGGFVQLHAHFLSAAGGTHCIEVHASKVAISQDDIAPWFKGFTKARIETY